MGWRGPSVAEVFNIVAAAHTESLLEESLLGSACGVDLSPYAHEHFLPEARNGAHATGMDLAHGLLNLLGISVDGEPCPHCEAEDGPSALKDMGIGQKVHHHIILIHRHMLVVALHGSMILSVGKDNAFAVASSAAGVEDISDVIIGCLGTTLVHLRLSRVIFPKFEEVVEIDGVGIIGMDGDTLVEDDDAFQRGALGEHTVCLVILLLLTDEEHAHLGIGNHEPYLLLAAGGIERHGNGSYAKRAKVDIKVLHGILREHADIFLHLHAKIEHGVGNLSDIVGELVP